MRKYLALCLVALFCCVTGTWAQVSGDGTEDNPFIVANGDQFSMPTDAENYIEFTAPSDGTLVLEQAGYNYINFWIKEKGAMFMNFFYPLLSILCCGACPAPM